MFNEDEYQVLRNADRLTPAQAAAAMAGYNKGVLYDVQLDRIKSAMSDGSLPYGAYLNEQHNRMGVGMGSDAWRNEFPPPPPPPATINFIEVNDLKQWIENNHIVNNLFPLGEKVKEKSADSVELKERERNNLLRIIGALSIALSGKSTRFKRGENINIKQISDAVCAELDGLQHPIKIAESTVREKVTLGISLIKQ